MAKYDSQAIVSVIITIRGRRVILDFDFAAIYDVPTKAFNQAVRRNSRRFPDDFIFRLTSAEWKELKSQFVVSGTWPDRSQLVTGSQRRRDPRYLPYAFTEHRAVMAANVLRSGQAVQMSVFVVRAFIKMRGMLTAQKDLALKLAELDRKLTERLDVHERTVSDIIQQIMELLTTPSEPEEPPPARKIGFHVSDGKSKYRP